MVGKILGQMARRQPSSSSGLYSSTRLWGALLVFDRATP